jgi:multiple sugar transport system permease protein
MRYFLKGDLLMQKIFSFKLKSTVKSILAWFALGVSVVWSIFPIFYIFSSSIKDPKKIFEYPPSFIFLPTLENYFTLAEEYPKFWLGMKNSLIITAFSIILTLCVSLPAAYVYSRYNSKKWIRQSSFIIIATRMFPPIAITIPLYPLLSHLNMIDKHITMVFLYTAFYASLTTCILKCFLDNIPKELEEAALIDGCNKFQSFFKITLPLISPGIIASSILVGISAWKEFLFAFLFTTLNAVTLPVFLSELMGAMFGISWGVLFAASFTQLLPVLIFLWIIQDFLLKGFAFGTEK